MFSKKMRLLKDGVKRPSIFITPDGYIAVSPRVAAKGIWQIDRWTQEQALLESHTSTHGVPMAPAGGPDSLM